MTELIRVSSSEVETYRQCRLKHQLQYIERWRTDEEHPALARGTLFHSVMEAHYGRIKEGDVDATGLYAAVSDLLYDPTSGSQDEQQEIVEWMYRGYVEMYGLDPDWEIVAIEIPLEVRLFDSRFILSGTCDLIVKDRTTGGLWIVDHKTCKSLPSKDFDLEDQTAVYTYLLRQEGWDIRGAIYNHCRTYKLVRDMTLDERFKRQLTVRTDRELETCAREIAELMEEAYSNHERRVEEIVIHEDDGTGEPISVAYDAPRTPDGERCGWKCNLTEACLAGRKYGPERTRTFLEDTGFVQHETKPGPTFNKERSAV